MSDLVIQPGASRRDCQLCFSRDESALPHGNRNKSFLSQTSQPGLATDNFIFDPWLGQRLFQRAFEIFGEWLVHYGQAVQFFPEVGRRSKAVDSQLTQLLFSFSKDDRTSAMAQRACVPI